MSLVSVRAKEPKGRAALGWLDKLAGTERLRMTKAPGKKPHLIAGLDIGTTKVTIVIGTVNPVEKSLLPSANTGGELTIDVVGLGSAPSVGIRQGAVVNVEATIEAIQKAREEAELMSGYQISDVWVAVGGSHIKSFDSRGMIAIRNKEVRDDDICRVIEAAKAVAVPSDREVLHVLPREYKVDEQDGIFDPIGMSGVRLETSVHIVTAGQTFLQNAIKCAEKAGLRVRGMVLQQLASALAVVSEDERKLGVTVVDMGGGTCDMLTYVQGSVAHTAVVPVGGQHFTQDIAMGLRTPQTSAEKIKKKHGCAIADIVDDNETIEVEGVGGRKPRAILRKSLCEVIEPRAEETLNLIQAELERSGLINHLGSGVVLTGGACLLEGFIEMGEFVFEVPVRRGVPDRIGGLTDVVKSPSHATAVGLLIYGLHQDKLRLSNQTVEGGLQDVFTDWAQRVKDFFGGAL